MTEKLLTNLKNNNFLTCSQGMIDKIFMSFIQTFGERLTKISLTALLLILPSLINAQTANPQKTPLPSPFSLKREEAKAGNFLARYAELVRLENEYLASKQQSNAYLQARAYAAAFIGDVREANLMIDKADGIRKGSAKPLENSPLAALKAVDAEEFLLKAADKNRVLMINDGHHQPQTRVLTTRLLRGLYAKGFRYLAMETLNVSAGDAAQRKYPVFSDGYYTVESVFGDLARQALEIGYKLVPYESEGKALEGETWIQRSNRREIEQARNLKERIFDKDPNAKLLVFAGVSHISEKPQNVDEDQPWTFMAIRFKEMTGIDPFTADNQEMLSHSEPDAEPVVYRDAVRRGWVSNRAVIFADDTGKAWTQGAEGMNVDAQIFLPPTKFVNGRPDWLARDLNRRALPIPPQLVSGADGLRLVQAFFENEPDDAVPADQILIRPEQPVPALMLPRRGKGKFRLRVLDETGKIVGAMKIKL